MNLRWMGPATAGHAYADKWSDVRIEGTVMNSDGSERPMTDDERMWMLDIADCYRDTKVTDWTDPG